MTTTTQNGTQFASRKVIIAIPTNTYQHIQFVPPSPPSKQILVSRTKPGIYTKTLLTYARPWRRESGLQGKINSLIGPICFTRETSDASTSQYTLAAFVVGTTAAKVTAEMDGLRLQEAVVEHLCVLVGKDNEEAARDVLEINYVEWAKEEWLEGAPTSAIGPGGLLAKYEKALREPFESLHFAGGETAFEWKG